MDLNPEIETLFCYWLCCVLSFTGSVVPISTTQTSCFSSDAHCCLALRVRSADYRSVLLCFVFVCIFVSFSWFRKPWLPGPWELALNYRPFPHRISFLLWQEDWQCWEQREISNSLGQCSVLSCGLRTVAFTAFPIPNMQHQVLPQMLGISAGKTLSSACRGNCGPVSVWEPCRQRIHSFCLRTEQPLLPLLP